MKKYTYKNKKTGERVDSDVPLKNKDLVLVTQIRDGKIKSSKVIKK